MFKTLSYFLVALVLIGGSKFLEANFYKTLVPNHPKDKEYKGEAKGKPGKEKSKTGEKAEEQKESNTVSFDEAVVDPAPTDSTTIESEEKTDTNVESTSGDEQPTEPVAVDSQPEDEAAVSDEEYFQNLKNSYLSPLLAALPEGRSREDVVIRYYKHKNDGDNIYSLRRLGYYLHEREAEDNIGLESNSLYYGSDVDVKDIQLVAYQLLQSGIPLKSITRSQYDWKYNSLEIGADSLVQNRPVLELSDIIAFTKE